MKTQHKHAALIKAWADGDEIEYRDLDALWHVRTNPNWLGSGEYRIKSEPKPDIVQNNYVSDLPMTFSEVPTLSKVKYTFDGETGKLKAAEVL